MSVQIRFGLDAVIKLRGWETDALKVEMSHFNKVLAGLRDEARELERKICDVQKDLVEQSSRESVIVPERREIFRLFLMYQREVLADMEREIERTSKASAEVSRRLTKKNAEARGLERKRAARMLEFESEQRRKLLCEADEIWLNKTATNR